MDEPALRKSSLLPLVRDRVRRALTASAAFRALPPDAQKSLAHDSVRAMHYILGGADGQSRPSAVTLAGNAGGFAPDATALAGAAAPARRLVARTPPPIGEAARQGGDALADLVQDVDFPAFVSGLV